MGSSCQALSKCLIVHRSSLTTHSGLHCGEENETEILPGTGNPVQTLHRGAKSSWKCTECESSQQKMRRGGGREAGVRGRGAA